MVEDRRQRGPNLRLDSWKEIASYFGRDERTVKRWEKDRGLPVHRLPGTRGGVFAFTDELAVWMSQRDRKAPDTGDRLLGDDPATKPNATDEMPREAAPREPADAPLRTTPMVRSRYFWLAIAALCVSAGAALLLFIGRHRVVGPLGISEAANGRAHSVRHTPSAAAQDLYLQGRYYWNKRTAADLTKALGYFQQAVAIDRNYALAYVGLADCYNLLREYAAMPEREAYEKAIAAARKAVELDDSLADAHNSLAFDLFFGSLDKKNAEQEFQTALKLNPNCELAHHWYASYLMTVGRSAEALEQIEIAQQLNSSSRSILADKALILFHAGQVNEAIALLKAISEAEPSFLSPHRYLAEIYLEQQKYPEYLAQATQAARLSKNEVELAVLDAANAGFRTGGRQMMLESMLRAQKKFYGEGHLSAYRLARTCSLLGQKQDAIAYLNIARDRHDSSLSGLLVDYPLSQLQNDPSYRALVSQLGLAPVHGS